MMRFNIALLILGISHCFAAAGNAQQTRRTPPQVKYITKDAVYVDAGRSDGLAVGDTLRTLTASRVNALIIVEHISSRSAACKILRKARALKTGDRVLLPRSALPASARAKSRPKKGAASRGAKKTWRNSYRSRKSSANQIQGYFSLQGYVQRTGSGPKLSLFEPNASGRLKIRNIAGVGLEFRLRQRSRYYDRSYSSEFSTRGNEWVHRFTELSLSYGDRSSNVQFGVGRVYSPDIRGIGYIDGAHLSTKLSENIRIGVAAGTEPNSETSSFRAARSKYGAFVTYERGSFEKQKLATTVALSGSYEKGTVNREFLYLQNNYWLGKKLSVYQSVEVDYNRNWRRAAEGRRLSFSNLYVTANLFPSPSTSFYVSYDARKNVRSLDTRSTPDSLFDDVLREGVSGGLSWNVASNMRLGANVFVRFQKGSLGNTISSSIFYGIRHFPVRGHSVTARLSYISTDFTTGYRPTLSYRLPIGRKLQMSLTSGGYIYQGAGSTTKSFYYEAQGHYSLMRNFFLAANFRQYLDNRLDSRQLSVEAGISF